MKRIAKRISALVMLLTMFTLMTPVDAFASSQLPPVNCDCKKMYDRLGFCYNQTTKTIIDHTTKQDNKYSEYKRGRIYEMQVGACCMVADEKKLTETFYFSVQPTITKSIISAAIGYEITTCTININGQISPQVVSGKTFIAPYTRFAFHEFDVVEKTTTYCSHGKVMNTKYRTVRVEVPYRDAAYLRFGAANTRQGLPNTAQTKNDSIFIWQ